MAKQAGLLDMGKGAALWQAKRADETNHRLAQIGACLNAILATEQEQLKVLRDIAGMTWEQTKGRQTAV